MTEQEIFTKAIEKYKPNAEVVNLAELLNSTNCPTVHCKDCPYAIYNNHCKEMRYAESIISAGYTLKKENL